MSTTNDAASTSNAFSATGLGNALSAPDRPEKSRQMTESPYQWQTGYGGGETEWSRYERKRSSD